MREPLVVDGRNFLDRELLTRAGLHLRGRRQALRLQALVLAGGEGTQAAAAHAHHCRSP